MEDILKWLYGLTRFGIKPGLETITTLLQRLGNPHLNFKSIHITGTNGKGSVAALIAAVLQNNGYKTGLYTSPHLLRFNERIAIDGTEISDEDLISSVEKIRKSCGDIEVTFFEFTTALAFLYFAEKKVDIAVVETGMGGRLDATSVLTPLLSIITTVDFDHMKYLGSTKEAIAWEKAGIIKKNIPVVVGFVDSGVLAVLKNAAKSLGSSFLHVPSLLSAHQISSSFQSQTFETKGWVNDSFSLPLLGQHQMENALVAIAALTQLGLPPSSIQKGLSLTHWPGRLEIISEKPLIIVDGAHNEAGMATLAQYLQNIPQRKVLILAAADDKPIDLFAKVLAPLFEIVIVTQGSYKPCPLSVLGEAVRAYSSQVEEYPLVEKAIQRALSFLQKDDCLLVTGSLYMIGDALRIIRSAREKSGLTQERATTIH